MINLDLIINGLKKMDPSDKEKLNKLLLNSNGEINNNPIDSIINALSLIKRDKENNIMNQNNVTATDSRVVAYLNQKEISHNLCLDYAFIDLLVSYVDGANITSDGLYSKWLMSLSEEDRLFFKQRINLFHSALYDYALRELHVEKKDFFNEDYDVTWFNISFGNSIYKISAHPNSELGTTFYKVTKLKDEEVILFDDVMNYYIKLKKEENGIQRNPKKEIE